MYMVCKYMENDVELVKLPSTHTDTHQAYNMTSRSMHISHMHHTWPYLEYALHKLALKNEVES